MLPASGCEAVASVEAPVLVSNELVTVAFFACDPLPGLSATNCMVQPLFAVAVVA
jgi:hypothetical protein